MRIVILIVSGLLGFFIVLIPGYFLTVPQSSVDLQNPRAVDAQANPCASNPCAPKAANPGGANNAAKKAMKDTPKKVDIKMAEDPGAPPAE